MIKFEITRDRMEYSTTKAEWSTEELLELYSEKTWTEARTIETYDSRSEAEKMFNEEIEFARSSIDRLHQPFPLIEFEVIQLWEVEYEDGEYIEGNVLKEYAAPIN